MQSHDDNDTDPPTILLNVVYPESYPDIGPYLDITSPPDAAKYALLSVTEDKAQLLDALQPTIEESLGMAMVFTLVSTLKEAAETLIADRQRQVEALQEVEKRQAEEIENRKFEGTKVTRESFLEWHGRFKNEMAEADQRRKEEEEAEDKKKGKKEEKKMTGRQLWEKGLVGKVEEEVDGADVDISKLKVSD